jgi:hypothetical protein
MIQIKRTPPKPPSAMRAQRVAIAREASALAFGFAALLSITGDHPHELALIIRYSKIRLYSCHFQEPVVIIWAFLAYGFGGQ